MKSKALSYSYQIIPLGENAFEAIIPKFKNIHVYGDTREELHEGVLFAIEEEIKELKKAGKPIPEEDTKSKFSGKIHVRIVPELHQRLFYEAQANQMSLNKYIEQKLGKG